MHKDVAAEREGSSFETRVLTSKRKAIRKKKGLRHFQGGG